MKLASYVGTRDSIMGLGNRLIRLRLSGIRQALQTDNALFKILSEPRTLRLSLNQGTELIT